MTILIALALEWLIGDPDNRRHPVAWFGRWAAWCESFLYADQRERGIIAWLFVIALPLLLIWLLHGLFGWLFDALLLWLSIGWRSLFAHVQAVLNAQTLAAARQMVSMIVSRDSDAMDMRDARRAALESLAENASDAVIAPLVWFLLLGAPGAALYRMINTLDAMWGYRNAHYLRFGRWAAKVDDAANWLPARITAGLLLAVGRGARWSAVGAQARSHASPNAGWPEVALAFAADIRLGGPVVRGGVIDDRPCYGPEHARDIDALSAFDALTVVRHALLLAAAICAGVSLVL